MGIVIKNKARFVAHGYTQEAGIEFDDLFAPVARLEAISLFLAYASETKFTVYQMDVKYAFLYRNIDEDVYVAQIDPNYPGRCRAHSSRSSAGPHEARFDQKCIMSSSCLIRSKWCGSPSGLFESRLCGSSSDPFVSKRCR